MQSTTLYPIALVVFSLFLACSAANPPVVGSFGDPLKWCPAVTPSSSRPTNVNSLRPSDINVVAALGDSITAGFGIDGFWGSFTENRGKSWAMGGDNDTASIANFLKRYSPNIQGASIGTHWVEVCANYFCPGQHIPSIDVFNAAQSGAWVQNLPAQASWLISQMQSNSKVDYQNDWKVITILIGPNNLCASCLSAVEPINSPAGFGAAMDETLKRLAQIPRAFINVVQIFNLTSVYEVSKPVPYCDRVHTDFPLECACAFGTDADRTKMDDMASKFRAEITRAVRNAPRRTDFAVVLQPILSQGVIPTVDYLSDLDCFHPSAYGQRALAIAVWNCMLLPQSQKPIAWQPSMLFPICPDEHATLRTD